MIRYFTPEAEQFLCQKQNTFGIYETKIYSQYQTYGLDARLLDLWTVEQAGECCGLLSRLDGVVTLCGHPPDLDECAAFVRALGAVALYADAEVAVGLQALLGGRLHTAWVLRRSVDVPHAETAVGIAPAERLQTVYELLCRAMPDFAAEANADAWLVEASHKRRHGLGDYYILSVENTVVSTAGILFRGQGQAVLGAIATDPAFRGRGYGARLTDYVAREVAAQGESPCLFAREDALLAFYEPLGFFPDGRWGELRWN